MDALRGIGAIAIYLVHVREFSPLALAIPPWVQGWGLEIFYFLSGFFIYRALFPRHGWKVTTFLWHRVRRLLPAYYVSILILVGLIQSSFLLSPSGLWVVTQHLLMIHTFNPEIRTILNIVYWMLGNIFWFSMAVAVLSPLFRSRWFGAVVGAGLLLCWGWRAVVFWTLPPDARLFWGTLLPGVLELYLLGMVTAQMYAYLHANPEHPLHRWLWGIAAVGLLCIAVAQAGRLVADSVAIAYIGWRTLFGIGFGAVTLALIRLESQGLFAPWLRFTGLPALGKISYSVFLYHLPVIVSFNYFVGGADTTSPWLLFLIMTASVLVVATGSYRLVEQRAINIKHIPLFQWRRSYPHEHARQN